MFTNTSAAEQEHQANKHDTVLGDLEAKRNERKAREAATAETGGCVNGVCQLNWKPGRPTLAA